MCQFINYEEEVVKYLLFKQEIYFINIQNYVCTNQKKVKLSSQPNDGFVLFSNKVYCNDWEGNYQIFNINLETQEEGKGKSFYKLSDYYLGNQFLDENGNIKEAIIDTSGKKNVFNDFENVIIKKSFSNAEYVFLCLENNQILSYKLPFVEFYWRYNLNDLGKYFSWIDNKEIYHEVEQFLGIYDHVLWVHLKGNRLLGLEVETGIIKYDIKNVPKGYGANFLNESRGVIQILALESYWEFDLKRQKFITEVPIHPGKKFLIRSCTFYENDTNIYFCGRYENAMEINCFGIFDSVTHQVVWYEVLGDKAFFPNPPQANEHKLYILDSENRLAIYEKSI